MSIWTPSGEHKVPRDSSGQGAEGTGQHSAGATQGGEAQAPAGDLGAGDFGAAGGADPLAQFDSAHMDGSDPQALDPEVRAELEAQMAEVRQRILETPVEAMVVQHLIGLFEIAAIHLNAENPDLSSVRLAIDAMDGALSATEGRLGDAEEAMQSMLHQARMAYVQVSQNTAASQN